MIDKAPGEVYNKATELVYKRNAKKTKAPSPWGVRRLCLACIINPSGRNCQVPSEQILLTKGGTAL